MISNNENLRALVNTRPIIVHSKVHSRHVIYRNMDLHKEVLENTENWGHKGKLELYVCILISLRSAK